MAGKEKELLVSPDDATAQNWFEWRMTFEDITPDDFIVIRPEELDQYDPMEIDMRYTNDDIMPQEVYMKWAHAYYLRHPEEFARFFHTETE